MDKLIGQKAEDFVKWLRDAANLPPMTIDEAVETWERIQNKEAKENEAQQEGGELKR